MKVVLVSVVLVFASGCVGGQVDRVGEEPDATPDATPAQSPEMMPDPVPEAVPEPDPCPLCCAADRRCAGGAAVEICRMDGSGFDPLETCAEGEVCADGQCGEPPFMCTPGETTCLDVETQQTCNVDGTSVTTLRCQDSVCIGGACVTGALTGESCAFEDDCAGGLCLCDSLEACPVLYEGSIGQGYCTMTDCAVTGCPLDEVCMDFSIFGGITEGRHCVKKCEGCDREGFSCHDVPIHSATPGEVTWEEACFSEYPRGMGSQCNAQVDCLGGTCWTGDLGPNDDRGYCTMPCTETAQCPTDTSCVEFPGFGFFCGQHCGNGTPGTGGCPENRGLSTFCQSLVELETNAVKSICGPRR